MDKPEKRSRIILPHEKEITRKDTAGSMSKSPSLTGLSSLSKGLNENQEAVLNMKNMLEHMKEIISKYETEVKELQRNTDAQESIIKEQKLELDGTKEEISKILEQVNLIWNS